MSELGISGRVAATPCRFSPALCMAGGDTRIRCSDPSTFHGPTAGVMALHDGRDFPRTHAAGPLRHDYFLSGNRCRGFAVLQIFRASIADAASGADSAIGGGSVDSASVLQWTFWIVLAWATGVAACSLRLIVGWFLSLRPIRSSRSEVPQAVERLLGRVHNALLTTRKMPRLLVGEK